MTVTAGVASTLPGTSQLSGYTSGSAPTAISVASPIVLSGTTLALQSGTVSPGYKGEYLFWNGFAWVIGTTQVSIGQGAGSAGQGAQAIAIGASSVASTAQASGAIAIGWGAAQGLGGVGQGLNSVAIGHGAALTGQGANSVAIGYYADYSSSGANSNVIVLNATGGIVNSATSNACYIAPIRQISSPSATSKTVVWDSSTKELTVLPTSSSGTTNYIPRWTSATGLGDSDWSQPVGTTNLKPTTAGSKVDLSGSSTNGVQFAPATGGSSTTPSSNTISVYEHGTWLSTATCSLGTFDGVSNTKTFTGTYTRIGRLVYFNVAATSSGGGSFGGNMTFTLPFTPVANSALAAAVTATPGAISVFMFIDAALSQLRTGNVSQTTVTKHFSGTYEV